MSRWTFYCTEDGEPHSAFVHGHVDIALTDEVRETIAAAMAVTLGDFRRAREVRDLLTASSAIPTETGQGFSGVKVKALDWTGTEKNGRVEFWSASTGLFPGADYEVWQQGEGVFKAAFDGVPVKSGCASPDEAKAAAQSDYVHRILSAIDIPAPAGGEEAVAWAAERLDEAIRSAGDWQEMAPDDLALAVAAYLAKWPSARPFPAFAHPAPDHHLRVEVERLRAELAEKQKWVNWHANRATTAETRIAGLEAAAKPFADFAEGIIPAFVDDMPLTKGSAFAKRQVTVGDFRALRSALASCNKPVEEGR